MTFLAPLGLFLALSILVLIAFHLLKVQPASREVGSTYLWERLLPDVAAHQPWQKPRFPPLFFIQLAFLLALIFAVARPAILTLAGESASVVFVLDATASMSATDVQPSRFVQAREAARSAISSLSDGSKGTLMLVGAQASVVVAEASDRAELLAALDRAQPTDAPNDLGEALRLAVTLVKQGAEGNQARVEVFTDGAFDLPSDLAALDAPIVWHNVGRDAPNRAITAFSARADPQNRRRQHVFLRVEETGLRARETGLRVEETGQRTQRIAPDEREATVILDVDGQTLESRPLAFDATGVAETVFEGIPDGARIIAARLGSPDALVADDQATLVLERPRETRVLLVSRGNVFLEKAVGLLPDVRLDRIAPRRFGAIVPEDYDVLIYDADVPDVVPSRPTLIVNPASSPFLPVEGQLRRPSVTSWDRDHPVLQHVDLSEVRLSRAPAIQAPGWARPIVESLDAPLVLAGEDGGQRVVVLGFDLHQSNLALTPSFPILIANTIGYLEPPGFLSASAVGPGTEIVFTPALEARSVVVREPGGREAIIPVDRRTVSYPETGRVGLYRVQQRSGERVLVETAFAVNLLSAAESDLRPRPLPSGQPAMAGAPRPTAREGWQWLLGIGLVVLVGEWLWYHRR